MNKNPLTQIFVVEASAGSGKTYSLAKRYLKILFNGQNNSLKEILAITFTNKASIEMKSRILNLLKKLSFDSFDNLSEKNELLEYLFTDATSAKQKAYLLLENIIKNYTFFQVRTIDSFVNSLVYSCAFKLNLSTNFKIEDAYSDYLLYSLDDLIEKGTYKKDVMVIFSNFLKHYIYFNTNPGWFPKKDIFEILKNLFYIQNIFAEKFVKSKYTNTQILKLKKELLSLFNQLFYSLPKNTNKQFYNQLEKFIKNNINTFDLASVPKKFQNKDFPVNKNNIVSNETLFLWENIRKKLALLSEMEATSSLNSYIDIYNNVITDFISLSQKKNVLFLEELNKYAKLLFSQNLLTIPELYYRLSNQIKHYLIDEFQDTSILQWQNLYPLVSEALSNGGTLFYVGDKKQAIYRFRGGEISLFDTVLNDFKNYVSQKTLLEKNYRSLETIVNFNNQLFSQNNLSKAILEIINSDKESVLDITDISDIITFYSNSQQLFNLDSQKGYVKIFFLEEQETENEHDFIYSSILKIILELKEQNCPLNEIAILTQKNSEVENITHWLLENNIFVESENTLDIRQNGLIKELVSLLKFFNSPTDNLSFATFILGDIFLSQTKMSFEQIQNFIFSITQKYCSSNNYCFYKEFIAEFPDLWKTYFEEYFNSAGFVPLYDYVISIITKFNLLNNFSQQQGFIMHFLELIKKYADKYNTINTFLDYYEKSDGKDFFVSSFNTDSVNVLTIHKSKGLEFKVVIIPFFELKVNTGIGEKNFFVNITKNGLNLLYLTRKYTYYSKNLAKIYASEYKKSFIDSLNNLYVACTRAKNELYIFVPQKADNENNKAKFLFSFIEPKSILEFGNKTIFKKEPLINKILPIPTQNYFIKPTFLEEEFLDNEKIFNRENLLKSTILHHIFSLIDNLNNQELEKKLSWIKNQLQPLYYTKNNLYEHILFAKEIIQTKKLKKFFYIDKGTVFTEKIISTKTGAIKCIDRLVITQDTVMVIDFKLNRQNFDHYKKQVQQYVDIVKELYPEKSVSGHLIYFEEKDFENI